MDQRSPGRKDAESRPVIASTVQLNCQADELASTAQEGRKLELLQRKMVRSPNNPIQVHVNNVTVTSKVKRTLWRLAKTPKLVGGLMSLFQYKALSPGILSFIVTFKQQYARRQKARPLVFATTSRSHRHHMSIPTKANPTLKRHFTATNHHLAILHTQQGPFGTKN